MAPPKDIARSYPKRGLTADVGFRSEPKFCGDGSVYFDGSSDYAETAASADLAVGDTFTLTAWVWLNPNPSGSAKYAFRVGDTGAAAPNIASIGVFGGANPSFYCYSGSASMSSSITCDSARWYHVASVIKSGSGSSQLFVDGIDVTNSHSVTFNVTSSSSKIRIGDWSTGAADWEGYLANACVFTESLTEDQVRQVMRASDYASHAAIATLEAFYSLSANFNDSTGNHNATASGSPEFRPNRPQLPRGLDLARGAAQARVYTGRALDQDGSVDRLQGTNFTDATATACTVSFWMYQRDAGPGRIIHNFGGGATAVDHFIAAMHSGYFLIAGEITSGNRLGFIISSLPLNQWHHVVFVLDGNGTTSLSTTILYLNGQKYDSPGAVGIVWDTATFDIGGTYHGYQNQLIAGVKVFNTKLTDAQARELYHNPEQVLPTGVSASNLRRYYPLSDYNDTGGTGGRYFQDMGADGEPAEDQGSCTMAFAQPVPCPQLGLQQSATRLYHPGGTQGATATITAPGTTVSLSAWVLWDSARISYAMSLGNVVSTSGDGFQIRINASGQITMFQRDGGGTNQELLSGLTVTEGEWNHIVVATRSDSPYWRCWLNNSEASSPNALVNTINVTSTNCNLGMNSGSFGMAGIANDAAVWNTELGDSDVAALYNSGVQGMDVSTVQSANLKGWWKFDDLTTLKDYSGNSANATVTGTFAAASFPENASGSTLVGDFSMKRKGVSVLNAPGSGRATLAANASLLPTTGGGYTLCAFVRLQSTDNDAAVIMSTSTGTNEWGTFYEGSTNKYKIVLSDGTTNILDRAFTGTVTDSEWHHIAWTIQLDAVTATGETYLDGAPDLSFTRSSFNTPPTPSEFAIGYDPGNADKQANAAIACLRIYQSVLSANEIKQVYSSDLRLIKGLANE